MLTLAANAQTTVNSVQVGKLSTPTSPTCKVRKPDGTTATVTLSLVATGRYQGTFDPTLAGDHTYRGEGTGAAKGAAEKRFVVRAKVVI